MVLDEHAQQEFYEVHACWTSFIPPLIFVTRRIASSRRAATPALASIRSRSGLFDYFFPFNHFSFDVSRELFRCRAARICSTRHQAIPDIRKLETPGDFFVELGHGFP